MNSRWMFILAALGLLIALLAAPAAVLAGRVGVLAVCQAEVASAVNVRRTVNITAQQLFTLFVFLRQLFRLALYGAVIILVVLILTRANRRPPSDVQPPDDEAAHLRAEIDRLQKRLDRLESGDDGEQTR